MFQTTQSVQVVAQPVSAAVASSPAPVTNAEVANILFNIATLLEMQQGNPYRIQAYRNAARGVMAFGSSIADVIATGGRLSWPGLGDRLRRKITELVTTGRMTFYDELCESSLPTDARDLMAVRYVGPKTALRLVEVLDIHSIPQLLEAAQAHRVRDYFGFGARSEQRLGEGALALLATGGAAA